jgi:eukaryotic-like serine/threonine-protein kinase
MSGQAAGSGSRVAVLRGLDRLCDEFEAQWQARQRPSIGEFLERAPSEIRPEAFGELLTLEVAYRRGEGEQPKPGEYLASFPEFADAVWSVFPPSEATQIELRGKTLSLPASAAIEGRQAQCFGDYRLLKELGRGRTSVVFKARRTSDERLVALKLFDLAQDEYCQPAQRDLGPLQAAAGLHHPGIVRIYEIGRIGGQSFFSMEFVEGASLKEMVARSRPSGRVAADYMRQAAEAVHCAHQAGLLHRDLNPANILVDTGGRVRITDFGLPGRIEVGSDQAASAEILGTPGFMSPEQARGEITLDGRTDIYSLGAVLYFLLTGQPPHRGKSVMGAIWATIQSAPQRPSELASGVDSRLETICLRSIARSPGHRYDTVAELAADIHQYLDLARSVSGGGSQR